MQALGMPRCSFIVHICGMRVHHGSQIEQVVSSLGLTRHFTPRMSGVTAKSNK
jgi:hypothetical protein